jgi:hypothetical protein
MRESTRRGAILAMVIAVVAGCGNPGSSAPPASSQPPAASPSSQAKRTLTVGAPVKIAAGVSIPGKDTTIPGSTSDPDLQGFEILIPAGAYAEETTFSASAAAITNSTFGPLVKPLSALITIENGGGYADLPVAVRIPAAIPADAVAGAFYFDPTRDTLEGVPIVARDETGMTVLTRHFSSIFIAMAEAALPYEVTSGFLPALDGWQIPNPGSFIGPAGYCSGASTSAMWYFLERSRAAGAAPLYGHFDNNGGGKTPALWEDDADAIRLASVVQADTDWDSLAASFFWKQEWISGDLAYDAFRYTIAVTGEPQLVFVSRPGGAHAMIVYGTDANNLLISDPNFPGDMRSVTYNRNTKTLSPYVGSFTYPTILYAAKSAIVPWGEMAADWAKFDAGTIGDGRFPAVEFQVQADPGDPTSLIPLVSGYETDQSSITVAITNPTTSNLTVYGYLGDQKNASPTTFSLEIGDNDVGFLTEGVPDGGGGAEWADFQRFTITRLEALPTPTPSPAAEGDQSVTVTINALAPTGGEESETTCPSEVTLSFIRSGGDPSSMEGRATLWAHCTDAAFTALDASGTFDGTNFALSEGRWRYSGTFDGSTVTITGGQRGAAHFVFPVGP